MVKTQERKHTLAKHDLRRVAVAAECDPDSVASEVANPNKVNNVVRHRIRRALRELKLGQFREPG
jgi:hypothetical protein